MQNRHVEVLVKGVALMGCGKSRCFAQFLGSGAIHLLDLSHAWAYMGMHGHTYVADSRTTSIRLEAGRFSLSHGHVNLVHSLRERMKLRFNSRLNARMSLICRIMITAS